MRLNNIINKRSKLDQKLIIKFIKQYLINAECSSHKEKSKQFVLKLKYTWKIDMRLFRNKKTEANINLPY